MVCRSWIPHRAARTTRIVRSRIVLPVLILASASPAASPAPAGAAAGVSVVAGFERFARESSAAAGRLSTVDAGRLLIGELGCTACHRPDAPGLEPKAGPDLAGVGGRVAAAWLRRFLEHPASAAAGTTMPDVVGAVPERDRSATLDALVAYLTTLREPPPLPKPTGLNPMPPSFWDRGDATKGRSLYRRIGCVACHATEALDAGRNPGEGAVSGGPAISGGPAALLDEEDLLEAGIALPEKPFASLSLEHVAGKYSRRSLTEFLLVPAHSRPSGRMPSFDLKAAEAADIAAYLLGSAATTRQEPSAAGTAPDAALQERGREAFRMLACAACHSGGSPDDGTARAARDPPGTSAGEGLRAVPPPLTRLDPHAGGSCIQPRTVAGRGAGPRYALDGPQRAAIIAALDAAVVAAAGAEVPPSAAADDGGASAGLTQPDLDLVRLNCLACHERGPRGGVGTDRRAFFETVDQVDLGDEGRLPPRLTGVGARLRPEWLAKAVAGTVALRPHLRARMPKYPPAAVAGLPGALARADRAGPAALPAAEPPAPWRFPSASDDPSLLPAGAALLDAGCVQCHPLGEHVLPGTVGVNLAGVTKRVEPSWFRRLLLDPMSVRPGTKMPAFFGATVNRAILAGDPERQIAALWAYLDRETFEPLPAKLAAATGDFELKPVERPVVLRTFMKRAGTHAIAVGFPAGVHVAFDADRCRLAEAWSGRFLDARGTWVLAKSAPPAEPLGTGRVALDLAAPLAVLAAGSREAAWPLDPPLSFLGYGLDAGGVPTFRYRIATPEAAAVVSERVEPAGDATGPDAAGRTAIRGLIRRVWLHPEEAGASPGPLWFQLLAGESVDLAANAGGRAVRSVAGQPPVEVLVDPAMASRGIVRRVEGATDLRAWTVPLDPGSVLEVRYRW